MNDIEKIKKKLKDEAIEEAEDALRKIEANYMVSAGEDATEMLMKIQEHNDLRGAVTFAKETKQNLKDALELLESVIELEQHIPLG